MKKIWRIHPHDAQSVEHLQRKAQIPALVAHLLICRGITDPDAALDFLNPKLSGLRDPEELPGVTEAAEHIHRFVQEGKRIVVYGDYDVDGMTATSLLLGCLKLIGAEVDYYIPHRMDEGYGLNNEAIRELSSRGVDLLVTVDCGVASLEEARTAREVGLSLVVTDHHKTADELPDVDALVHPALPHRPYAFAGLAGVGVAFKLAWALCQKACGEKKVPERMRRFLMRAVGLAAVGTIADVVPLVDENRVIVRQGLDKALVENAPLGLTELMKASKIAQGKPLTAEDIGYALGPRLNAAGRLGQARLAVELLTTEREDRAKELAEYISGLNETRQKLERGMQRAAVKQVNEQFDLDDDAALVLADRGWHQGVIGIVAGRLAERYHRPVVMLAMDQVGAKPAVGSCRSVPGVDLYHALKACEEHLVGFGGHAMAAGLRIEESRIADFRAALSEYVATEWREDDRVAEIEIDAEFPLSAFTRQSVGQIEWLAPFGTSNRKPVLCTTAATLTEPPKYLGSGERHMACRVRHHDTTMRAVAFGRGEWVEEMKAVNSPIDIVFRPVLNTFAGRTNVELQLIDWRVHEEKRQRESA